MHLVGVDDMNFFTANRLIAALCRRQPLPSFSTYRYLIVSENQQNEFRFIALGLMFLEIKLTDFV